MGTNETETRELFTGETQQNKGRRKRHNEK